jgi:hypothetical protein
VGTELVGSALGKTGMTTGVGCGFGGALGSWEVFVPV